MERQAANPSETVRYLFLTRDQWTDRDAVVTEMRRRGARPEEIKALLGPDPPRIEITLRTTRPPRIDPVDQWSEDWGRRWDAESEQYRKRMSANSRQAYVSFLGEYPKDPTARRVYGVDRLVKWAASHLLNRHHWKDLVDRPNLTSAGDLENAVDAIRKAVADFLKWTRLDPASIARNKAAHACSKLREIHTWIEQGNDFTEEDKQLQAEALSTLAEWNSRRRPNKAKGRPKVSVDARRVVQLRNDGATWKVVAAELKISATTARREYQLAKNRK